MNGRRCFHLVLICLFWLSASAIAFGGDSNGLSLLPNPNQGDMRRPRILVVYQSKYGSTKQYAEWIQKDIEGDLVNLKTEGLPPLAEYDIIVAGGYIRAGEIIIAPFIRDHWNVLKEKKVVLFTTSGTPPHHSNIRMIYEKSFSEDARQAMKYFPLPGRISTRSLTFFDKLLLAIGKILERDEALKRDMDKDRDGVKRENLLPMLEYLQEIRDF